mgnify:CR=1 FL=1
MYKIVRFYRSSRPGQHIPSRTIETGLTLEQAQKHCEDPETSSATCSAKRRRSVRPCAAWFDGYTKE